MWPDLPFDFVVVGTPVSVNSGNGGARDRWKQTVANAALSALPQGSWAFEDVRLSVTIFYFPQAAMPGDVDNIVKATLDGMIPNVYLNDALIDRMVVQRFNPDDATLFVDPSPTLITAMESGDPVLYIRLDTMPAEVMP